jgi:hypothetical protein
MVWAQMVQSFAHYPSRKKFHTSVCSNFTIETKSWALCFGKTCRDATEDSGKESKSYSDDGRVRLGAKCTAIQLIVRWLKSLPSFYILSLLSDGNVSDRGSGRKRPSLLLVVSASLLRVLLVSFIISATSFR